MVLFTEQQKAYISGLFDAEGCYSLSKTINKLGYTMYDPLVRFATTYKPSAQWVLKNLGGKVKEKQPKNRIHYHWRFMNDIDAALFLSQLLPYIIIKKDEAEVLMEYYSLRGIQNPSKREYLFQKMIQLKTRPVTTNTLDFPFSKNLIDSYFAGFFDGEGTICMTEVKKYSRCRLDISLANSYKPAVTSMLEIYGGCFRTRPPHNGFLPMHEWSIKSPELKNKFLDTMSDFLITKKPQLDIAKHFISNQSILSHKKQMAIKYSVSTLNGKKIESELLGD